MPEYVYALHDFHPENEDELSFSAGDRIEVIEKDDQYGDGWWQGKNLDGIVGLFPNSYTAPAPPNDSSPIPISKSTLVPLDEESETESAPKTPPPPQNGGDADSSSLLYHRKGPSAEMMKATMTDIQQAIEQLGRGNEDAEDGDTRSRNFSFASSKDDVETDTDLDNDNNSDLDGAWHGGARKRLAERAAKAVEEAERLQAMSSEIRSTAPPIDVELSDESDDESNLEHTYPSSAYSKHQHPHIPEEDEEPVELPHNEATDDDPNTVVVDDSAIEREPSPPLPEVALIPAIATIGSSTTTIFPNPTPAPSVPGDPAELGANSGPGSDDIVTNGDREIRETVNRSPVPSAPKSSRGGTPDIKFSEPKRASLPRSIGNNATATVANSLDGAVVRAVSPSPQVQAQFSNQVGVLPQTQEPQAVEQEKPKEKSPNEWTLDDVVEWLKTKGFDEDVQNKFIEQEITGDVLLELDANLLKSEIGIMAFGKRVRIANAIGELRHQFISGSSPQMQAAPSQSTFTQHSPDMSYQSQQFSSSTPPHAASQFFPPFPSGTIIGAGVGSGSHARTYSLSQQSQNSYRSSTASAVGPGGQSMLFTHSMPAGLQPAPSLPSPITSYGPNGWGGASVNGNSHGMNGDGGGSGAESKAASVQGTTTTSSTSKEDKVGLGFLVQDKNEDSTLKSRPTQLSLSPSFGALSDTVKAINGDEEDEDRGHMSDYETVAKKQRRRLFGLSQDSSLSRGDSNSRHSASSAQASPKKDVEKDSAKSHARPKRSFDGPRSGTERLSMLGAAFTGSLGRSRKPPPRYSTDEHEKSSIFPRFSSSMGRKASGTPNGSPKFAKEGTEDEKKREKDKEVTHVLRKRTSSYPGHTSTLSEKAREESGPALVAPHGDIHHLKQGESILEQIGEPDNAGWMRKKSEKYSNWKTRYFVLSGHHLYWLKSNSRAETKIKGYINITGYKVTVDETVDPGKYGFRIDHDTDKTHYFSSESQSVIRDWMKAIMKATIGRDYSKPVISSCNIPTISLTVAQAMNPAPRPPSPSARAATQKAHRPKDLETLGMKDLGDAPHAATLVLMGLGPRSSQKSPEERARIDSTTPRAGGKGKLVDDDLATPRAAKAASVPPRPARESRRQSVRGISTYLDRAMLDWANLRLPLHLRVTNASEQTFSGLALFRLAESIKGRPASPPVPDSAFPSDPLDDKSMEGLFALFDFLVNNEVKMGSVSINEIRQQRPDKIAQIVKALKSWEDRRKILSQGASVPAGAFMAMNPPISWA